MARPWLCSFAALAPVLPAGEDEVSGPKGATSGAGSPAVFAWGDVEGDGRLELAAVSADGAVQVLASTDGERFEDASERMGLAGITEAALALFTAVALFGASPMAFAQKCLPESDSGTTRIQRGAPSGVTTIAGTGAAGYAGDGGRATNASLHEPQGIGIDPQGNVYFADNLNFVIRKIDRNGIVTTVAGNGVQGFSGDNGPAILASLGSPVGIHVTADGSVLIADMSNHRIRLVDAGSGIIFTIAGNGGLGFSGDGGPATAARLNTPQGVSRAVNSDYIYIADTLNLRVRRVDASNGTITTVCGTGFPGSGGDGGLATAAGLTSPRRLTVDSAGNVFILDRAANARIRRIDAATGIITTVAGGGALTANRGPATQMNLGPLTDVAVNGNTLLVAASFRVWRIAAGTATAFAGTGAQGFSGDGGHPLLAEFNNISGLCVNPLGEAILSDRSNHRIRKLNLGGVVEIFVRNL